jgi:Tfp pilus assembly protein PilV
MQKEKLQKNTGISLVETIIYVAIFSMIVTTFVSFSSSMTTSRLHNQKVLEVNDQGGRVMKMLTQSIRNADVVNSPTIGNNASSLSLNMYQIGVSPTVFFLDAGVLYITEAGGAQVALTNNKVIVSDLNFSNFSRVNSPDIIKISFTISSVVSGGGDYSYVFNGSAQLRK